MSRVECVSGMGRVKWVRSVVRRSRVRLEVQNETSANIYTQYNTHTHKHKHTRAHCYFRRFVAAQCRDVLSHRRGLSTHHAVEQWMNDCLVNIAAIAPTCALTRANQSPSDWFQAMAKGMLQLMA